MKMLTLDPGELRVESFASRSSFPARPFWAAADTDDADCDTESRPDCPTLQKDECETVDCTDPDVCGQQTEECL